MGKCIEENNTNTCRKALENCGDAEPGSRGALGLRLLLLEPLGWFVYEKIDMQGHWVVEKKGSKGDSLKKLHLTVLYHLSFE